MGVVASDAPIAVRADDRFDTGKLAAFLAKAAPELKGTLEVLQFPAGHSNLTYMVRIGDKELVVKRAPPGIRAKGAHDMGREYRVLSKLAKVFPYAPNGIAYCEDETVIGSPFCVMERLTRTIVRSDYPDGTTPEQIGRQFGSLIDGLADLHSVDVEKAGLSDLGKPQGYRQRQLDGWKARLEAARTDDMADFSKVLAWFDAHIPKEPEIPAIIHNDFKMDNLVWDPKDITKLKGVLDWEMSTCGDPLMDLSCTLSFWIQQDDPAEFKALRGMPSARPEVFSRREAIERYAARTGKRLDPAEFYLGFAFFRRAVIEQQKYVRFKRGDTKDPRFAHLNESVRTLRDMAEAVTR